MKGSSDDSSDDESISDSDESGILQGDVDESDFGPIELPDRNPFLRGRCRDAKRKAKKKTGKIQTPSTRARTTKDYRAEAKKAERKYMYNWRMREVERRKRRLLLAKDTHLNGP